MSERPLDFGDYCLIEQKRYGMRNEMYDHKVIGRLRSSGYVDVPVRWDSVETIHPESVDVVACIRCGIEERKVLHYRESDVRRK